jgi:hypothetical protein
MSALEEKSGSVPTSKYGQRRNVERNVSDKRSNKKNGGAISLWLLRLRLSWPLVSLPAVAGDACPAICTGSLWPQQVSRWTRWRDGLPWQRGSRSSFWYIGPGIRFGLFHRDQPWRSIRRRTQADLFAAVRWCTTRKRRSGHAEVPFCTRAVCDRVNYNSCQKRARRPFKKVAEGSLFETGSNRTEPARKEKKRRGGEKRDIFEAP